MDYQVRVIYLPEPSLGQEMNSAVISDHSTYPEALHGAERIRDDLAAHLEAGRRAVVEVVDWTQGTVMWRTEVERSSG
ncbi:hypothetical protein HNR42_001645 [Deinobacterium chartae]|uniref:Uncharacterized protein n=1 Tax=Deinobacterium chartae TaxID=521158 RepID=A0A841I1B4_9DEIO|nr:hypothetical protein [Deinobacterium chartae]MBB6098220.1 hypothetical protein [Deinobacterium chartae]